MVTKEQAATATSFKQTRIPVANYGRVYAGQDSVCIDKPINWRANGKLKTWKRDTTRFSLPIKHGLYSYGYITNDNCHLFEVA